MTCLSTLIGTYTPRVQSGHSLRYTTRTGHPFPSRNRRFLKFRLLSRGKAKDEEVFWPLRGFLHTPLFFMLYRTEGTPFGLTTDHRQPDTCMADVTRIEKISLHAVSLRATIRPRQFLLLQQQQPHHHTLEGVFFSSFFSFSISLRRNCSYPFFWHSHFPWAHFSGRDQGEGVSSTPRRKSIPAKQVN